MNPSRNNIKFLQNFDEYKNKITKSKSKHIIKSNSKIAGIESRTTEGYISSSDLDPMNMTFNKSGNKSMSNECPYKDFSSSVGKSTAGSQLNKNNNEVKKELNFSVEQPNIILDSTLKGSIFSIKGI